MPGIMGTNIYDLEFADTEGFDYADLGHAACENATSKPVVQGNIGAGIGATVGPFFGTKGGGAGGNVTPPSGRFVRLGDDTDDRKLSPEKRRENLARETRTPHEQNFGMSGQ